MPYRAFPPAGFSFAVAATVACVPPARSGPGAASPFPAPAPDAAAIARARADSVLRPWTAADVRFMTAMIAHHAQAIHAAGLAPSRGASRSVATLAERIAAGQRDEIAAMQHWLADRRQPVPEPRPGAAGGLDESAHHASMPGMLTDAQLRALDAARGPAFDRLFLSLMIQHHRGAIAMVKELFATPGAAQDQAIFRFASDVSVDQGTEIARMERMLAALPPH